MRRLMNFLALLLTAALLAAGAVLPGIVSAVMDEAAIGKSSSAAIQPVRLEVTPSGERSAQDLMGKLRILQNMYTIPLSTTEVSMTEAEVFFAMEQAMDEYIAAGIFEWFDFTFRAAEPFLGIDPENTENNNVFWTVTYTNESKPYETLLTYIDDETGRILFIRHEKYGTFTMDGVWDRNTQLLSTFAKIYFSTLDISEDEINAAQTQIGGLDGGVSSARYAFSHDRYGLITVELYAIGDGSFYVYFPNV